MFDNTDFLEEEAHVATLFENRARRFRKLVELSKSRKGVPVALLEKERNLLGVAAIMWIAIHPLEDEPQKNEQIRDGRAMIRDGMGGGLQAAEEQWTQFIMSDEFSNNPLVKKIETKPFLTLHTGGTGGNSNKK